MSDDDVGFAFKITIIGDGAIGKTTLIKKFTSGEFQKEYIMTLGAQFTTFDDIVDGVKCRLHFWDIAGQEAFEKLRPRFYKGSRGAIIVFSHAPGEEESFDHISHWLNDIKKYCDVIPIILFGNKIDLIDEAELSKNKDKPTSDSNLEKLAKEHQFLGYYKTSALTGHNVTEAFQTLISKLYNIYKQFA